MGGTLLKILDMEMSKKFGSRETVWALAASTLMDPRFKKLHFNNPLAVASVADNIRKEVCALSSISSEVEDEADEESEEDDLWSVHCQIKEKKKKRGAGGATSTTSDDLAQYLSQPTMSIKTNPIDFWLSHNGYYPKLHKTALKYMTVVGSSVPSERIFSKAGRIMAGRSRLSAKKLNETAFLASLPKKWWDMTM